MENSEKFDVFEKIQKILQGVKLTPESVIKKHDGYEVYHFCLYVLKKNSVNEYYNGGYFNDAILLAKNLFEKNKNIEIEISFYVTKFDLLFNKNYSRLLKEIFMDSINRVYFEESWLVNKTPHDVVLYDDCDEVFLTIPAAENPLRLVEKREKVGQINGFDLNKVTFEIDKNTPLPYPDENTYFIVSRVIAETFKRPDFIIPDQAVRNESGQVIGCKGFAVI